MHARWHGGRSAYHRFVRADRAMSLSVAAISPDWSGFFGEGPPTEYAGLPGAWYGIRYDFVTGEGDSGQPGLPPELLDCLAGS